MIDRQLKKTNRKNNIKEAVGGEIRQMIRGRCPCKSRRRQVAETERYENHEKELAEDYREEKPSEQKPGDMASTIPMRTK